jgi:branched-chain amino acid transport system ATP-binding protein
LLLEAKNISVYYGAVKAIEDVSFYVNSNEIVAMIGPNGAGKSTALKAVFGLVDINSGDIFFNGENIKGLRPDEHVSKGISLIPEGRRLFPSMTVVENLEMGAFTTDNRPWTIDMETNRKRKSKVQGLMSEVFEMFPPLYEKRSYKAGVLSTGEQQMLALGRALMQKPKVLLADEPSLGLSPSYVDIIFEKLIEVNKSGTSILLVEQNARMALEIAHRGYVFKIGSIFMKDTGKNLLNSEEMKRAFLGG